MPALLEWSPDGQYLVFGEGAKWHQWHLTGTKLLVVDASGTRLRTLVVASEDVFQWGFRASVSQVNWDVLYTSCEFPRQPLKALQQTYWGPDGWTQERGTLIEPGSEYAHELAVVGFDGADKRRLTHSREPELDPRWSPDGKRFAYEGGGLRVAEEGSLGRRVFAGRWSNWGYGSGDPWRWSPDGTKILLAASPSVSGREALLYVVDVETALQRRNADALTRIAVAEPHVSEGALGSFSPDGEQVVWAEGGDEGHVIYTGNVDGSGNHSIVALPELKPANGSLWELRWSPAGGRIMFWTYSIHYEDSGHRRTTAAIYVVNEDGSGLTKIYESRSQYAAVRWSPDGSRIAIRTEGAVVTMAPDGTDEQVLVETQGDTPVAANPRPAHPLADPASCSNGVVIPDPAAEPGLLADCEALLEGRDTLAAGVFLDWHEGLPIREWEGVTVAGRPARVTEVVLRGLGLQGRLPESFGRLEYLERLDLWHNELGAYLPVELGGLTRLRSLDLSYNYIGGSIPPELGRLTNLEYLDLSHNHLSGPLPGELGVLVDLRVLKLQDNRLGGVFPAELGSLGNLEELRVSRNRDLEGCVPDTLRAVEAVGTLLQRCRPEEDE